MDLVELNGYLEHNNLICGVLSIGLGKTNHDAQLDKNVISKTFMVVFKDHN